MAWTKTLPSLRPVSQGAVTGGVAYVGSGQTVTALDAATGAQLWQATLEGQVDGTPAVQDGAHLQWGGDFNRLPPVVSAGRVYMLIDNELICYALPGVT